jgi:ABC-type transport system involved in cytochrome c biogenesis permease subunit
VLIAAALLSAAAALGADEPFAASAKAVELDRKLDWRQARLIVVQDAGRYKTLESFARESMAAMCGREHLPALSPLASLFDWLFNGEAYADTPIVKIRDRGLRIHLSTHLPEKDRQRIQGEGHMTPRELADPTVLQRLRDLEPRFDMGRSIGRVRNAQTIALALSQLLHIVPQPGDDARAAWNTPDDLKPNAALLAPVVRALPPEEIRTRFGTPVAGITPEQAAVVVGSWEGLRKAWLAGDAAGVQDRLSRLANVLPTLAAAGGYPDRAQRVAEARYYAWGKFTWGYWVYFLGALVAVWALLTRWRVPWLIALVLLLAALGLHAYGVGLRWYILGRIPVANMFEAITASAWVGIVLALALELVYRMRTFLLAAHATGFFALLLANQVLPGELTSMMGILDDLMLRLHTTLIISSYALIFLAAVIAVVYLVGYYAARWQRVATHPAGALPALAGAGFAAFAGSELPRTRPVLAGALPSDGGRGTEVPLWLQRVDWSHLIMLNMMFVLLFIGVVLGAVWADYSWGRPWGWDPKEVFAMNTWLVYAILIHLRLLVRNKGYWTAWLSLAGCGMMAFNWWVVNFYIVGLHSYA